LGLIGCQRPGPGVAVSNDGSTLAAAPKPEAGAAATNWTHWRGPEQTGVSREKGLPDEWDPRVEGKDNLVWKKPYGCRSTPMVMNGRVYIIGADNEPLGVPTLKEKHLIGERVVCFDAKKGDVIWDQHFNVFHTDIVANRLGWAPLAGDAENKHVFAHTTAGFLVCFDADTGKIIWQRQLTEEFGRFTGYGGRLGGGPVFDSGLVFVGIVNSSWGNQGPGGNRILALDGKNGQVVWWGETPGIGTQGQNKGTYYSNPVVAVIGGERLLITGGSDGGLHAFQVRTGKRVWSYRCAAGVINPSPVVAGNLVYISHGEENIDGGGVGRVMCFDASKIVNEKPTLVWEFRKGVRFGLASLAIADGKLYVPDDAAKLYCFDAKKGKVLWKYNYGTTSRGAPVIADGKIYISETTAKFHIIKLKADDSEPDENETHTVHFKNKPGASGFVESNCTPSIVDGRIYVASRDELYCISKGEPTGATEIPSFPAEKAAADDDAVAQLQVIPAEVTLAPGATAEFELRAFNKTGQLLKNPKLDVKWTLPLPPLPKVKGASQPPALDAKIDEATGKITLNPKKPSQQAYVDAVMGNLSARSRVRVAPQIPYKQNFETVPIGAVPTGWINAQGKFRVVELKEADGTTSKVLSKVNTDNRPPLARALGYITTPTATGYTIEADLKGVPVRGRTADMGVCANRYLLILDGKTDESGHREVRLTTWEALPTPLPPGRVAKDLAFDWKPETWYRVKLSVDVGGQEGVVRAKIWERAQQEPAAWMLEMTDPRPNKEGAAALYGYISNITPMEPGSEIYYDNVVIAPNEKK